MSHSAPREEDDESLVNDRSVLRDSKGWDGKLRLDKSGLRPNVERLENPELSDPSAPPVEQIEADKDLLDGFEEDIDCIDLVHCRISSIEALRLERFQQVTKLCLRQNAIQSIPRPSPFAPTLEELDLYDNLLSRIEGLDNLSHLSSLDLSFNKISKIQNVSHLSKLKEIYFVQNRIKKIENLEGLVGLTNLELAGNRIRVIENLERLTMLEELWLGANKITSLQNIPELANLRILSVQANRLTDISGLGHLANLEELYVSENPLLTSMTGLASNLKLRVLDITKTKVAKLEGLEQSRELEELWASECQLDSFEDIEKQLGDKEKLTTVYFRGNPLETRQPVLYRNKVRLALPRIKQIDETYVTV